MSVPRPQRPQRPITALDDERFSNVFDSAFKAMCRRNGHQISESETTIEREADRTITATVRVYGMAGDLTSRQFCDPATKALVKGADVIRIAADGYSEAAFKFVRCENRTGNEYAVIYTQEAAQA